MAKLRGFRLKFLERRWLVNEIFWGLLYTKLTSFEIAIVIKARIGLVSWLNSISTFVAYLMPKPSL